MSIGEPKNRAIDRKGARPRFRNSIPLKRALISLAWTTTPPKISKDLDMDRERIIDFYRVLDIQQDASQEEIKRAYHRALLRHHPDKKRVAAEACLSGSIPAIDTVREAFRTLSEPSSRREYDRTLESQLTRSQTPKTAPRPANIISLDDFEEVESKDSSTWTYPCRCGGGFIITELLLEQDVHLIGCDCCSEVLWVGYESQES